MHFTDRAEAGRHLGEQTRHLHAPDVVVVSLPGGGIAVAVEVAAALQAPLDVLVVQKLGVPFQPELAMGAVGPDGVLVVNPHVLRAAHIDADELATEERRTRVELDDRVRRLRAGSPANPLAGRRVVLVDDGMATGATVHAACQAARAEGAARVVVAVPVATVRSAARLCGVADETIRLDTMADDTAIGSRYTDFRQIADDQVVAVLAGARDGTRGAAPADDPPVAVAASLVRAGPRRAPGRLAVPAGAFGVVVSAHTSTRGLHSPRNLCVLERLHESRLATLSLNLLAPDDELDWRKVFDVRLLADRLSAGLRLLRRYRTVGALPVGLFGAGTAAAAALAVAAGAGRDAVAAIACHDGRPDLDVPDLPRLRTPTLLIVGGRDEHLLDLNQSAQRRLHCVNRLAIIPDAGHCCRRPAPCPR